MGKDYLNGNTNLKVAHASENITPEEFNYRIYELMKCKNDIIYFANKYYTIISPKRGKHIIELYDKQIDMLRLFAGKKRVVVLSSRQVAKTTNLAILALHYVIFNAEKRVMVVSNKLAGAIEVMDRMRLAYEHLPNWLKSGLTTLNKTELRFGNNSGIKVAATSSDAARGYSANMVLLDEFAHVPRNLQRSFFTAVYPIISTDPNSKVIITSTPNGVGEMFHQFYEKALSNVNDDNGEKWVPFRIDWWEFPGRDEKWKALQIESLGSMDAFNQEYGNSFLASSYDKLISDDKIVEMRQLKNALKNNGKQVLVNAEDERKNDLFYVQYYAFNPYRTYMASVDCAEGTGGDSSVLYIWDITDFTRIKMAAKYSSNTITPTEFAYVINYVCAQYQNPYIAGERNSCGASMFDALTKTVHNYENFIIINKNNLPGIMSHIQIKSKACLFAREIFSLKPEYFTIEIHDENILIDAENFIKYPTAQHIVYKGREKKKDDHIMCMLWFLYILSKDYIEKYYTVTEWFITEDHVKYPKTILPLEQYNLTKDEVRKLVIENVTDTLKPTETDLELIKIALRSDIDPFFGDEEPEIDLLENSGIDSYFIRNAFC